MDNDIVHVDISSTDNTVLALSEDGITGIWQNASSPTSASAASSGPKSKRKIRSTTRQPDSSIKVVSSDDESSTIPILMTAFMSGSDKDFVIIARGSTIKPAFETVVCIHEKERHCNPMNLIVMSITFVSKASSRCLWIFVTGYCLDQTKCKWLPGRQSVTCSKQLGKRHILWDGS